MSQQPSNKTEPRVPMTLSVLGAIGMVAIVVLMFYLGSRLQ